MKELLTRSKNVNQRKVFGEGIGTIWYAFVCANNWPSFQNQIFYIKEADRRGLPTLGPLIIIIFFPFGLWGDQSEKRI